jgi:hypothetical protein
MLTALLLGAISSPPAATVTPSQVTIVWRTDQPESTDMAWGSFPATEFGTYTHHLIYNATLTTVHSRTLADLAPGQYFFRVRSIPGNVGAIPDISAEATFTVPRGPAGQGIFTLMPDLNGTAVHVAQSTVFVGGEFSTIARRRGQFVQVDAASGALNDGVPRILGWVSVAAPDGAGGVYLGGPFIVDSPTRHGLIHLLPGGGLDPDFNAASITDVNGLALRGGTLYAFGSFTTVGGMPRGHAAALDATTGALLPWTLDFNGTFLDSIFDTGTTVYVVGDFTLAGASMRTSVAALDLSPTSGTLLPFSSTVDGPVYTVTASGAVVFFAGSFTQVNGVARGSLAAVDAAAGDVLPSWSVSVNGIPTALATSGTTLYLGGTFSMVNGMPRANAAAVDATGTLLPWAPQPDNAVNALVVDTGQVWLGGNFSFLGSVQRRGLAAVDPSSGAPLPFAWQGSGRVAALSESSGTLWTSLSFGGEHFADVARLAAFNADTGRLLAFAPQPDDLVHAFASNNTTLYAVGDFSVMAGQARGRGAAFSLPDLALLPWDPQCDNDIDAMALGSNAVYVGGLFTHCAGVARNHAAAFDPVTGALLPWDPNVNAAVTAVAIEGAQVFIGGAFTSPTPYLLATDAATGAGLPFGPTLDAQVLALQALNGDLLIGGDFTSAIGRSYFAAVNLTSEAYEPLDLKPDGRVAAIVATPSALVLGGVFSNSGGSYHRGGAVLSTTGVPQGLDVDLNGGAVSLAIDCTAGRVHFAGGFLDGYPTTQNAFISNDFPVACFGGSPPSLIDNQAGDLTWRRANSGLYDVDFADPEGLGSFWVQAMDSAAGDGNIAVPWRKMADLTGTAATANWPLNAEMWTGLGEGPNYLWVRVVDAAGNGAELSDAFFVRKDTVPPTAPAVTGAAWDGGTLALAWLRSTDATSGVAAYLIWEDGGATSTFDGGLFVEVPAAGPSEWAVLAVDFAGNISAPSGPVTLANDGGMVIGPQPDAGQPDAGVADAGSSDGGTIDGGSPDAGPRKPRFLPVGCGCQAGAGPLALVLLAFPLRRTRRAKNR